jgi:Tfp pilus assembly protein PilV
VEPVTAPLAWNRPEINAGRTTSQKAEEQGLWRHILCWPGEAMRIPRFTAMQGSPPSAEATPGSRGFSTIEVMVAVLICGIVFVTLYSGISSGFAFVQVTRENLRGVQIMEEKMETIRLYRWDQINKAGFIPTTFLEGFYPLATQAVSGLVYTGSVTITDAPITEDYKDALKQVTVSLSWKSGNAIRQRSMTTLVSEYGLQNYVYGIGR